MKLFISADIEGTCGISHWDETGPGKPDGLYHYFKGQMTREVAAACEGATAAGFDDILVKDAHGSARNLIPDKLPRNVRLHRGWARGLCDMMDGLEKDCDAVALTGYHAPAHDNGNPLSHTMNTALEEVTINGVRASELMINSYYAGMLGIPVVFASGDEALCRHAKAFIPGITTVETMDCRGDSTTSPHPDVAVEAIRQGVEKALTGEWKKCTVPMPSSFHVTVRYFNHQRAYGKHFYPGARLVDEKTIAFESTDYTEILRFFLFVL